MSAGQLRQNSSRPELLLDDHARRQQDPTIQADIGRPAWWGRRRVVFALPLGEHTSQTLAPHMILRDSDGFQIGDPNGNLVGFPQIIVPRMLTARWTEDTRRLAG